MIPKQHTINRFIEESNQKQDRTVIDDFMSKHPWNWKREIIFDWISYNPRSGAMVRRIKASATRYPCTSSQCEEIASRLTYLQLAPTGLINTCMNCRKTSRVGSFEQCDILSTRRVSIEEAYKILDTTGQLPPIGIPERGKKTLRFMV